MSTSSPAPLPQFSGTQNPSPALFSPAFLASATVWPLRYFFSQYGASVDLVWDKDPTLTQIEIDTVNNFHKVAVGSKPRVLVDRGDYRINPTGLTDDLAEKKALTQTLGLTDSINFVLYAGTTNVLVQTRQEGSCERVTDMVQHFLLWTKPYLCRTQRFKTYAKDLIVSRCAPTTEDIEVFQTTIQVPWVKEEAWRITNEAVILKGIDQVFTYTT